MSEVNIERQAVKHIKLLSFDLDNALYDNTPVLQGAEKACRDYLQQQFAQENILFEYAKFEKIKLNMAKQANAAFDDLTALRLAALTEFCQVLSDPKKYANNALRQFLKKRQPQKFEQCILNMLAELAKQYQLVSVSNGNCQIEKTQLQQYFAKHYSPSSGFRAKPHPQMLSQVAKDFNLSPAQICHIGDSLLADRQCAQNAGTRFYYFSPFEGNQLEVCVSQLIRFFCHSKA
ncbi:HAD-IA family hydrolase [Aliikangiella sp. IMCC44632]